MSNRSDTFDRSNGSLGTPSDAGSAWSDSGGTGSISSNEFLGINLFAWTPANLETSTAVGKIAATVKSLGNSGIGFRYVDSSNFWMVQIQSSGLGLFKRVSGTFTQYGSTYSGTISVNDVIEVEVTSGNVWTVKQNGTLRINPGTADSAHSTATKLLMANYSGSSRYDDLSFTDTASSGYTITAAAGNFALTGNAAGLRADRKLTAAAGSFALTGNAAGLYLGRRLSAAAASYAWTANAASLVTSRRLVAAAGAYVLTGNAAALRINRLLAAASGSYTFTGNDASLVHSAPGSYSLTANAGAYSLTGNAAALRADRRLTAAAGLFNLTGSVAQLLRGYRLAAAAGSFALTGNAATLSASQSYSLSAAAGAYALTGNAATLTYSGEVFADSEFWKYTVPAQNLLYAVPPHGLAYLVPPAGLTFNI